MDSARNLPVVQFYQVRRAQLVSSHLHNVCRFLPTPILWGRGVYKAKIFKGKAEAKLEFPDVLRG